MGQTIQALTIKTTIDLIHHLAQRQAAISNALRGGATSSFTTSFSTIHFKPTPGTLCAPKRNFHSASAHPTRGFFNLFRSTKTPASSTTTTPASPSLVSDQERHAAFVHAMTWSLCPVNPGAPNYYDTHEYTPDLIPEVFTPEPIHGPTAEQLNRLFETNCWSLCIANAGEFYPNYAVSDYWNDPTPEAPAPVPAFVPGSASTSTATSSKLPNSTMGDEEYAAFLDKSSADREPQALTQSTSSNKSKHTTVTTSSVPSPLQDLKATYTSDADEPFEPVSLERKSKSDDLTANEVTQLIGAKIGAVSEIDVKSFDPKGDYTSVLDAVRAAVGQGGTGLKAFKVEAGGARVEYWVLGVKDGKHVVGVKALAVES